MNRPSTRDVVRVKVVADHQRQASITIETGKGYLSRAETSFLHAIREQVAITSKQRKWLADLTTRIEWELSLEHL